LGCGRRHSAGPWGPRRSHGKTGFNDLRPLALHPAVGTISPLTKPAVFPANLQRGALSCNSFDGVREVSRVDVDNCSPALPCGGAPRIVRGFWRRDGHPPHGQGPTSPSARLFAPVWRAENLRSFNRWTLGFTRPTRSGSAVEAALLSLQ